MTDADVSDATPEQPLAEWVRLLDALTDNVARVIFGKRDLIRLALIPLLARGHLLLEDVPGVGKTMLARALARSIDAKFGRVQFTPDLMPLDITGSSVFLPNRGEFEFKPGPIFTDVLLADEINRATPRTQAALLECMAERQVTVDGTTHPLAPVFLVMATLNPIEQMGTWPLPEAQLDRFLLRLSIGYPDAEAELEVLEAQQKLLKHPIESLGPVLSQAEVRVLQEAVTRVAIEPNVRRYIVDLASATRADEAFRLGVSPRGSLALMRSAQAFALLHGRMFVAPPDVQAILPHVWSHRLLLHPQAALAGTTMADALAGLIERVSVPLDRSGTPATTTTRPDDGGQR
ncbi:MAG: AAA family ATPase [Planctomycetota bacterium]